MSDLKEFQMQTRHAVAWLDHRQAKLFFFNREGAEIMNLSTTLPHPRRSAEGKSGGST